jgi:hypothetical protein
MMAKFLYVGTNRGNQSGLSAKAYSVRRMGKTVLVKYGPVVATAARTQRLHWVGRGPNVRTPRFRTEAMATAFVRRMTKLRLAHGYDRLPGRVRIWPPLRRQ